ncbi:hypothetical protein BDZ85DRAFT_91501 [Elsinoe ampelina]|uniref:Uncharacterized protein n=1 Tax=Elsinoe ampelina TaxID=302913 RepID=A0A6A6GI74_9PEZI|nr:hypothetical protein BDZ85DRAFT_91501 [Elsinoe ampelina]
MPVNDLEMALSRSIPVIKSRLSSRSVTAIVENAAKNCQTSLMDHGSIARSSILLSAMITARTDFSPDQVDGLWPLSPSLHAVVKRGPDNSVAIGLLQSLSTILIQTAVVAAQAGFTIPTSSIKDLLSVSLVPQSTANRRRPHIPSALFSRRSTVPISSHTGWRETLSKAIEVKSATEHETIFAAVASICADLEQRCHDFEAPLRAEKTKLSKLQCEYDELTEAFGNVESQLVDRDVQVSNMEAERQGLHADLNEAAKDKTNLLLRVDEAEARLQKAQQSAREEVARLQQKCEESDVRHASEKARHLEEIEMLTGRGKQLARDGQAQMEQLRREKTHRVELENKILSIEAARFALAEQVESTTEALKALRTDMSSAQDKERELRDRLTSESNELKSSRIAAERLRSEMLELKESTEREKQDFLAEYHASADQAQAKVRRFVSSCFAIAYNPSGKLSEYPCRIQSPLSKDKPRKPQSRIHPQSMPWKLACTTNSAR